MQARRMARELALLGLSQLSEKPGKFNIQDFKKLLLSAVQTLTAEAKDALETASDELKRGSQHLVDSGTRASDVEKRRGMVDDAIALTQTRSIGWPMRSSCPSSFASAISLRLKPLPWSCSATPSNTRAMSMPCSMR
jgi:hypothetical protein